MLQPLDRSVECRQTEAIDALGECGVEITGVGPLDDSRRRLQAVLDNATVAIFLMDAQQHCVYMNKAAEDLTGYRFEEVSALDRPLHDIIHHTRPDGSPFPLSECIIDRAFPERNQTRGEETFVHKDGSFYPVAFTASPIRDDQSQTIGTIIEVRDISAEKQAKKELEDSRRRLDAIVRSVMDAIITVDEEQRIVLFNPAAEEMFGCPAETVIGQPLSQFIPERHRQAHDQHIRRFRERGVTNRRMGALGAISGLRASGEEFPIEASISHISVGGERLSTVVLRDITQRKANEEARNLLAREVDHRAKNALAVAQALVGLTKAQSIEAFADAVRGRIAALARAHSLLSQSQWQGADLEAVICDELTPYASGEQMDIAGPDLTCSPEAVQPLGLIFHELATNAAKHGAFSQADGRVHVAWAVDGDQLAIDWTEVGGETVQKPERIGFGTRLLDQLVTRQMRGRIERRWGACGLEVQISLPATLFATGLLRQSGAAESPANTGETTPVVPQRVLLVEDEELIALNLAEQLSDMGWSVVGPAGTLSEAYSLLTTTVVDAAVLDVNLRGQAVYPLAEELERRGLPFVFCTGYEVPDPQGRFGTVPVLRKPTTGDAIATALHNRHEIAARSN
jgi:PAS domain S-box-containing protein